MAKRTNSKIISRLLLGFFRFTNLGSVTIFYLIG